MTFSFGNDWFTWGLVLLIGFPIAMLVLGEALQNLERFRATAFATPIKILRSVALPLLFIAILLRGVIGYDSSYLAVKIADTAFWIVVINLALSVVNVLFFGEGAGLGPKSQTPKLLLDLIRLFIVAVAAAIVVSTIWGIDLGGLLTALGVGSIVIGLALQDTLGSVFSGIAMLSTRQVKVGDMVQIGQDEGVLTNMNWRSVTIRTGLGDDVILPNSSVARERLVVIGGGSRTRCVGADVKLAYDHPPDEAMAMLEAAALAVPGVSKTSPPAIRLSGYDDYAIRYSAWITCDDLSKASFIRHQFYSNVWYAALRKGFVFPAQYHGGFDIPDSARIARTLTSAELTAALYDSGAFSRPADALAPLVQHARRDIYRSGEVLIAQGSVTNEAFVVLKGAASGVYRTSDETTMTVHEFQPGQVIMFKSLLRGTESPVEVRATGDLVVIAIPAQDLKEFLACEHDLAEEIERVLAGREDTMKRELERTMPGQTHANGAATRVDYLRDMFRVY